MAMQPSGLSAAPHSIIFCKLAEGALGPISQVINEDVTQYRLSIDHWGTQLVTGHLVASMLLVTAL